MILQHPVGWHKPYSSFTIKRNSRRLIAECIMCGKLAGLTTELTKPCIM